jgi:hypothetical protein
MMAGAAGRYNRKRTPAKVEGIVGQFFRDCMSGKSGARNSPALFIMCFRYEVTPFFFVCFLNLVLSIAISNHLKMVISVD